MAMVVGRAGSEPRRWLVLMVALAGLVLSGGPARSESGSPCDSATVVPAGQDALRADCEALWEFYTNLRGKGNLDPEHGEGAWGPHTPLAYWHGVTVDEEAGRVVGLGDRNRIEGLYGKISPALGRLTHLRRLDFGANLLVWRIPPELGQLTNLTWLNLESNSLSGPLPAELGNLENLRHLLLFSNKLSGQIPSELGRLSKLVKLDLRHNELIGPIPPELGRLARLRILDLGLNEITGPIPRELGRLANLKWLYLQSNRLSGSLPEELGQLTNLERLDISGSRVSGPIPAQLGGLARLQVLDLSRNRLLGPIPSQVGELADLRNLYMYDNEIGGPIPKELGRLEKLARVWLWNNKLSGSIPPELGQLSKLSELRLDRNALSGSIPAELGRLAEIEVLGLSHNQLTGPVPPELGGLSNLTVLSLAQNRLAGSIPPELGGLANLRSLSLSGNDLTGAVPPEVGDLPKLQTLHLWENRLSRPWPRNLLDPREGLTVYLGSLDVAGPTFAAPHEEIVLTAETVDGPAPVTYEWEVSGPPEREASGQRLTYRPGRWGHYRVRVTATDSEGVKHYGFAAFTALFDIAGHAFVEEIVWLGNRGITRGCDRWYSFCPDDAVNRGQMAAFLMRALNPPGTDDASDHFDDDAGSVFEDDINRLAHAGITMGCGSRRYCPAEPITRSQMAAFLSRALRLAAASVDLFDDDAGSVFEDDINRLAHAGITMGCGPRLYCPDDLVTRGQMAAFLYRARDLMEQLDHKQGFLGSWRTVPRMV